MQAQQIVLYGDSITEFSSMYADGLAPRLIRAFERKMDIVTRGYGGYTTRIAKVAQPYVLKSLGPGPLAAAVIFFGANDTTKPGELQHVPLDEYRANLEVIVDRFQATGAKVIVVGPAFVTGSWEDSRDNDAFVKYSEAAGTVAVEKQAEFVDLNALFNYDAKLLEDGLHLSNEGYKVLTRAVLAKLVRVGIDAEETPRRMPDWRSLIELSEGEMKQKIEEEIRARQPWTS